MRVIEDVAKAARHWNHYSSGVNSPFRIKVAAAQKMSSPEIAGISPFFIVENVETALAFYRDSLGFKVTYQEPSEGPFFGIVNRGRGMIMLKSVGVEPTPNYVRHAWARWDAYIEVPDPDTLADEYSARGVEFSEPLKDTDDGLREFELRDSDGYVLFFGRPRP